MIFTDQTALFETMKGMTPVIGVGLFSILIIVGMCYLAYCYVMDRPMCSVHDTLACVFGSLIGTLFVCTGWLVLSVIIAYTQGWSILFVVFILCVWLLLRTARGVVRLKRQLKNHCSNPNAHKEK